MTADSSAPVPHRDTVPPTIIVVHPRERRSKCSVEPLRGRDGFVFWQFPSRGPEPLDGYVRLGLDGPLLGPDDAHRGLLVLDGTWRLTARMEADYEDLPVRRLPDLQTAYPRTSKIFKDPPSGLATIEAVWAAYQLLGRSTDGLLDSYRWSEIFASTNLPLLDASWLPIDRDE